MPPNPKDRGPTAAANAAILTIVSFVLPSKSPNLFANSVALLIKGMICGKTLAPIVSANTLNDSFILSTFFEADSPIFLANSS
ncbi:Uncharacterised protein [Staphylococcus aureus]|nr:Uncharacterised protein [Staphylococcus aureus]